VAHRLEVVGPNELREAPRPPFWKLVLEQFTSFVVLILIVASVVSAVLGDWVEAAAIMAIVLLNAIIGVVQESKAEEALAALKKLAAPNAYVIRDGVRATIASRELVPGDIVVLEDGNYIPADVRLIDTINLRIEEAALTGESVPVEKTAKARLDADIPLGDRKNTAFMGTLVTRGRGRGAVIATGMHTQMGLIAQMLQTLETEPTPLQRRLDELGKQLGVVALVVCGLVFAVAAFNQTDLAMITSQGLLPYFKAFSGVLTELFIIAVSLAIAAVPEGLPAVVTISLALGMREMINRHALIRKLSSVETLGSATVICSDKTGTLTQNEMTVTRVWAAGQFLEVTGTGYVPKGEFRAGGNDGRVQGAAIDRRVRTDLDVVADLETADLRKLVIRAGLFVADEPETVAAQHGAGVHDDARTESRLGIDSDARDQLAVLADRHIVEQHATRPDARPGADADVPADDSMRVD
jgi:Ca2+-transporting ATPase